MADVPHTPAKVARVISGGQTGADRGGLEGARRVGAQTGGWAPKAGEAARPGLPAPWPLSVPPAQEETR